MYDYNLEEMENLYKMMEDDQDRRPKRTDERLRASPEANQNKYGMGLMNKCVNSWQS